MKIYSASEVAVILHCSEYKLIDHIVTHTSVTIIPIGIAIINNNAYTFGYSVYNIFNNLYIISNNIVITNKLIPNNSIVYVDCQYQFEFDDYKSNIDDKFVKATNITFMKKTTLNNL